MRAVALAAALCLAGCVNPRFSICGQPGSCVVNACTTDGACSAKPLELTAPSLREGITP